ncbi:MAG: aspartate-semialdehyde dehydrogenase [Gammaproteobacteria bacterium]|nr:aspartate-semialdehyde dehydrogenase [Gammaproteobacteria bacterium]MCW8986774.1 aspartate-semialdehyde dehydrogenase [Gammaproteobacteria bacterium]MCW9031630.1 aspartate-semialdehyde dehydrogenase [Gammaproteobacteria bacterium]
MIEKVDIAIIGATTSVGETLLEVLEERKFPVGQIFLLESEASSGSRLEFSGYALKIGDVSSFDFSRVQIAFFVSTEAVSKAFAEKAASLGCIVIDRTPAFRNDKNIPLIIPEVNEDAIEGVNKRKIISMPSCTSIQMLLALKPIHDAVGVKRINVSTYQSVSGSGKDAAEELASQTAALLNFRDVKCKTYPKQIAFNVLPQIGEFLDNGYTDEEMKLVWETQKVLNDESITVNATSVRVPVFIGHAASVHIETKEKISAATVCDLLKQSSGIELVNEQTAGGWPTPVTEAAGKDSVFVGRVREDISSDNGINLWLVTDNMRKGAAVNAVQIAEILVKLYI